MTFRRVMLVVLPLLAALFVFMVLRYAYSTWLESFTAPAPEVPAEGLREPAGREELETAQGTSHEVSTNVNLVRKDREGRIEMRFLADVVVHRRKDTCDITRPRIQFFTRRGEVITLSADYATAVTDGPLTDIANIRSGRLWGNVVLVHDRNTYDNPMDDILVGMDDLVFDNETYEMATDGGVVMASEDMDLTAHKMRIVLDRKTRSIDTMTFYEDIFIVLEAGDRLQMGLGKRPGAAAAPAPESAPPSASAPVTSPAAPPTEVIPGAPTPPAAAAPAPQGPAPPESQGAGGNLWRIDLAGNVDARQLAQRLLCDLLTLYNETARSAVEGGAPEESPAAAEAAAPAPVPAGAPTGTGGQGAPAPGAGTAPAAGSPAAPSGAAAQATAPAAPTARPGDPPYLQPGAVPPLVVIADGPMIITPVPSEERRELAGAENEVTAVGKPAVVEDGETRVVGREIHYNLKTGGGLVVGTPGERILEQPDRMWLTGGRLTFDRTRGTAEVAGEGKLHALVATDSFTGERPAEGPKPEPSALDAQWTRGMRLEFYELPEGGSGTGQLRQAAFSGQAEVVQKDGLLRGDELVIHFFPAEEGRGQAVQRLVGHGDVFVKNTRPSAAIAGAQNVGDITCQDLDMLFARGATGGSEPQRLNAAGKVLIHDAKGTIRAEHLAVTFGRNAKGELDADFLDATGNVLIDRGDLKAEGDHVRRDLAGGVLVLEGKPARAARGASRIVGPYVEFLEKEGKANVRGAGELEVPATTDLRGQPRAGAEPLVIRWGQRMYFEDKRNFAFFDTDVKAATGGSRLDCRRLWVYFRDAPETPASGAEPPKPQAPGELGGLLGRKAIERLFADENVLAAERRMDPDASLRYQMEIAGANLTYLAESRKAYMRGPGRMRILSRERPEKGKTPPLGPRPEDEGRFWADPLPNGYSRTHIAWAEGMAYDGPTDRAYFKGNVESIHIGRGVPGETGAPRPESTTTKIRSADLQVAFSESPPTASAPAVPREERMGVEKMVADGGVQLWVDDRRGSARRLMYQRQPELLRLYSGPDQWARLWQSNEALQEFGEVAARVVTFYPATKRVDMVDQQELVVTPR